MNQNSIIYVCYGASCQLLQFVCCFNLFLPILSILFYFILSICFFLCFFIILCYLLYYFIRWSRWLCWFPCVQWLLCVTPSQRGCVGIALSMGLGTEETVHFNITSTATSTPVNVSATARTTVRLPWQRTFAEWKPKKGAEYVKHKTTFMRPVHSNSLTVVTFMIVIVIAMVLGTAHRRGPLIFADSLDRIQTNSK